ncbi:MAG: CAP domain-containing protein [Thermoleophilia bacterium]|nr:CAP domain-containing protein [Thermoleophilia bacterium]
MPNIRRMVALALGGTAGALAIPSAAVPCATPDRAATLQVTSLISKVRGRAGLPPVKPDRRLMRVALRHSRQMARSGSLWHDNLAGWARGRRAAQNVAYGASGVQSFRAMWLSRMHHHHIMTAAYRSLGVGAARTCDGTVMVTVNLMG